jgi:hypothetical protein
LSSDNCQRKVIKELTSYWLNTYDWRAAEVRLNQLPNFKIEITVEGFNPLNIHFIHQKSSADSAIPLLFVYEWPGSFIEIIKMLPFLKGGDGMQTFHVMALSLPNYSFSSRVKKLSYVEQWHLSLLILGRVNLDLGSM